MQDGVPGMLFFGGIGISGCVVPDLSLSPGMESRVAIHCLASAAQSTGRNKKSVSKGDYTIIKPLTTQQLHRCIKPGLYF